LQEAMGAGRGHALFALQTAATCLHHQWDKNPF